MKHLTVIFVIAAAALGAWQFMLWKSSQDQLAIAQARVTEVIATGSNNLNFNDLTNLRKLPENISEITNLKYLSARETHLSDLSALKGNTTLEHLDLNKTRVSDLTPLTGLPKLKLVYLHDTWVSDLSPLMTLPSVERIDIGKTQIASLEPLSQIESLNWLNLYHSHALDGSAEPYSTLQKRPFVDLNGGTAYAQNYRPGWQYNAMKRLSRFKESLGI